MCIARILVIGLLCLCGWGVSLYNLACVFVICARSLDMYKSICFMCMCVCTVNLVSLFECVSWCPKINQIHFLNTKSPPIYSDWINTG